MYLAAFDESVFEVAYSEVELLLKASVAVVSCAVARLGT